MRIIIELAFLWAACPAKGQLLRLPIKMPSPSYAIPSLVTYKLIKRYRSELLHDDNNDTLYFSENLCNFPITIAQIARFLSIL